MPFMLTEIMVFLKIMTCDLMVKLTNKEFVRQFFELVNTNLSVMKLFKDQFYKHS